MIQFLTLTKGKEVCRCLKFIENHVQRIVVETIDEIDTVHGDGLRIEVKMKITKESTLSNPGDQWTRSFHSFACHLDFLCPPIFKRIESDFIVLL